MKKLGLLRAMRLCRQYKKLDETARAKLREERLRDLVAHARANSPYYAALYKDLPTDFALGDLPPVNKRDLMAHFDDWPTDRSLHLADLREFMGDSDNIGRKFRGQYLVFTTSGSTGEPLVAVCDETTNAVMGAINATRSIARREDMRAFLRRGGKTIGVFATGGFYLGNSSVRARLLAMPWKKRQMAVTSALLPTAQIVAELNAFQPAMLGGYPSNLELLIEEQKSGRLHIAPALVMTGGEYLSDDLRARLAEAFSCYVQTSYSCTEGGTIACECPERRFHINDDWLLVEPVDGQNRPVPAGVRADKLLLTNLSNHTQPFIRYEISDRATLHRDVCPCGNPSPWLTLEGRTDEVLSFAAEGRTIRVAPLALYAILKELPEIRRFQIVGRGGNRLELRLVPEAGVAKEAAFARANAALRDFLRSHGVQEATCLLSPDEPRQHPRSGKFQSVLNDPQS